MAGAVVREGRGWYRIVCSTCRAKKRIWYGGEPVRPDLCLLCFWDMTDPPKYLKGRLREVVDKAKAAKAEGKPARTRILIRRAKFISNRLKSLRKKVDS